MDNFDFIVLILALSGQFVSNCTTYGTERLFSLVSFILPNTLPDFNNQVDKYRKPYYQGITRDTSEYGA